MSLELEILDTNCNNCKFMVRDMDKFKQSLELHHKWQLDEFNKNKQKLVDKANWYKKQFYDLENWDLLLSEAENLRFQLNKKECLINYGRCSKLDKDVSFIPNLHSPENDNCFEHRRTLSTN